MFELLIAYILKFLTFLITSGSLVFIILIYIFISVLKKFNILNKINTMALKLYLVTTKYIVNVYCLRVYENFCKSNDQDLLEFYSTREITKKAITLYDGNLPIIINHPVKLQKIIEKISFFDEKILKFLNKNNQ